MLPKTFSISIRNEIFRRLLGKQCLYIVSLILGISFLNSRSKRLFAFMVANSKWHYKFSGGKLKYKMQRLYTKDPHLHPLTSKQNKTQRQKRMSEPDLERIMKNNSIKSKFRTILDCGKKKRTFSTLVKIDVHSLCNSRQFFNILH